MKSEVGTSARNSLWLMFFVMGVVSMAWVPRIPEIKEANGLSDTQFGLVLISSSVGAVVGAQLAGRLIHRFGSRPAMYFSAFVVPLGVVIMALSNSPFVLVVGLFVLGFSYAWLDVGGNAQGVAIEKILAKGYMASFHGMWSLGTLASTIFGATVAYLLTPQQNLLIVAGVGFVVFLIAARKLLPPSMDGHAGTNDEVTSNSVPWFALATLPLWFMGIGSAASFIAEGAAADWGALLLRDWMGIEKGLNASAFATFGAAMLIS
jgi:MFS family permease